MTCDGCKRVCGHLRRRGGGTVVFDAKIVPGPDKKPTWQVTIDAGASTLDLTPGRAPDLFGVVGNREYR